MTRYKIAGSRDRSNEYQFERFHGMVLRSLIGDGNEEITRLVDRKLLTNQIILGGTRDLDPPEKKYVSIQEIPVLEPSQLISPELLITHLDARNTSNVYVHLDLDVLDPTEFSHVVCPTPNGLRFAQLEDILSSLKVRYNVVGLGIVEGTSSIENECRVISDLIKRSAIADRWS